ncbi:MAG: ABC transporter ATP-binding protein [Candidatus Thorarchaeota archaeon]|nr:ABC transporter ATP-binding protein [Candidatus Thorarchaeota archaeon]
MSKYNISIKTSSLTKDFGSVHAVRDLDLEIPVGTRFGFLGPNGAGKTTTVRMLSGLLKPTSGQASVFGMNVLTQQDEIKALTGMLPETPGLYSKLSAVEFLEFIGALNEVDEQRLYRRIDSLLAILGLEERQENLLESYSSGMKQKVLIAATLLHDPKLVFLDEPTSRLDPSASILVKDLILALARETGTTFVLSTHQTALAEEVCDMIGLLIGGRLVATGSPQEIVESAGGNDLEEAYLNLVGGRIDSEKLLTWRS